MNIPEQIKTSRQNIGLSQRELAKAMGVPHSTVVRIESGQYNISQATIEKFCKATNFSFYFVRTRESSVTDLIDKLISDNTVLKEQLNQIKKIIK